VRGGLTQLTRIYGQRSARKKSEQKGRNALKTREKDRQEGELLNHTAEGIIHLGVKLMPVAFKILMRKRVRKKGKEKGERKSALMTPRRRKEKGAVTQKERDCRQENEDCPVC